jgi:hypothetical protein
MFLMFNVVVEITVEDIVQIIDLLRRSLLLFLVNITVVVVVVLCCYVFLRKST